MMVVYRFTKYAHFCYLFHPFNESIIVIAFMEIVYNLHGNLKIIVSDRDLVFTGNIWIELFSCLGT